MNKEKVNDTLEFVLSAIVGVLLLAVLVVSAIDFFGRQLPEWANKENETAVCCQCCEGEKTSDGRAD